MRGKSFAIMADVSIPAGLFGHTGQVITRRPAHIAWRGSSCAPCATSRGMAKAGVAVVLSCRLCRRPAIFGAP